MKIKVKKFSDTAVLPQKQSKGAAGYDLCADISEAVSIMPHGTVVIQSNIGVEIPEGYFGAVYARSGMSTKRGLRPATCVSVIDSDYRGSIGLPIHNDTNGIRVIEPYERVAQLVIQRAIDVEFVEVDELDSTDRGVGGFGSTGK